AANRAAKKNKIRIKLRPRNGQILLPVYSRKVMSYVSNLACSLCSNRFPPDQVHNLCSCGGTLFVRYDLARIKETWTRDSLKSARPDLWRYLPVLPPQNPESIVSLGEGMTPLIRTHRLGAA